MTATVFNQSQYRFDAGAGQNADRGAGIVDSIAIVGGGTAGWMTALILASALARTGTAITLLESPAVETIGVGEGSTPWLRGFFNALDIEEREWMPECNATYKCGIRFDGWSTRPGFERYFHPFASMLDNLTMPQFVHNVQSRINGANVDAHPDRFFMAAWLARQRLGPIPAETFPFDIWYGYHFDAVLLGRFLRRKAEERGVRYRSGHVTQVNQNERGEIVSVATREGDTIRASVFVDCTGFASLLIGKALNTPFVSFAENLFNDSAVALPTPIDSAIPSETVSTAMRHGWAWKIPLTNRFGNGYVYSSSFCNANEAETELRAALGLLGSPVEARHLKMRIGRVTQHWNRNCLAVGLSQGFIEPLEATALLFIQQTAATFAEYLLRGDLSEAAHETFNARVNEHFEGTRDYIVTHYKTNSRTDSDYWRANAANRNLSEPLKQLLNLWMSGNAIAGEVGKQTLGKGYPIFSWYCLLAGVGIFPDPTQLRAPTSTEGKFDLQEIQEFFTRSAGNFRPHAELLGHIPPRRDSSSLQAYFW